MKRIVYVVDQRFAVVVAYREWDRDATSEEIAAQMAGFRLEFLGDAYEIEARFSLSLEGARRAAFTGKRLLEGARRGELVEKADKVVKTQDPAPTPSVRPAAESGRRAQPPYRSDEGFFEHPDGSRSDEGFLPEPSPEVDLSLRLLEARLLIARGGTEEQARRWFGIPARIPIPKSKPALAKLSSPPNPERRGGGK